MRLDESFAPAEDGARLYCRIVGDGAETLLVPNAVWLEKLVEPLARGRRLVLYDLRSRGRSERVTDPARLGLAVETRDLEAVRRHVGAERIALLGHSYPATTIALYAMDHPERVTRLLMVGAMAPSRLPYFTRPFPPAAVLLATPGAKHLEELRAAGADKSDPAGYARAFMREFLMPSQLADPAKAADVPLDACDHPNEWPDQWLPLFADHVLPSFGDWDYRPRLSRLTMPLLVVHGAQDRLPLDGARDWVRGSPDARLLVIDGSGHYPFVEQPDVFYPAAERFLSGAWPEAAAVVSR